MGVKNQDVHLHKEHNAKSFAVKKKTTCIQGGLCNYKVNVIIALPVLLSSVHCLVLPVQNKFR
jgi:hypothetical protein